MRTGRLTAAALTLLALAGCQAGGAPSAQDDVTAEIADAPSTGPYDVGDVIPSVEAAPHEARRDAAERLAADGDREFVWVTDAYTIAEGGEVVEVYYAVDGTGEVAARLREEWMTFDDPDEALDYATDVVEGAGETERYDVVPLEP